mgnify:CR=1 FL=1
MKTKNRRPFLSQMIKRSRVANKKNPLPPPQDMKLRMTKGQKIRLSFTRFPIDLVKGGEFPDLEQKPLFSGGYRHYVAPQFDPTNSGGGYVVCKGKGQCRWCNHHDENTRFTRLGIGTTVVVWPILSDGSIDHKSLYNGIFDVMPWVFGKKIYSELSVIQDEFPLGEFDILLTCDREKYQRINIRATKGNMYKRILTASCSEGYWLDRGLSLKLAEEKMSYYGGICSFIIQDTKAFTKLLPLVIGKEQT